MALNSNNKIKGEDNCANKKKNNKKILHRVTKIWLLKTLSYKK